MRFSLRLLAWAGLILGLTLGLKCQLEIAYGTFFWQPYVPFVAAACGIGAWAIFMHLCTIYENS